jgi:hypothetical protein
MCNYEFICNIEKELILTKFLFLSCLLPIFSIICACFDNL